MFDTHNLKLTVLGIKSMVGWLQGSDIMMEGCGKENLTNCGQKTEQGSTNREERVKARYIPQGHASMTHPDIPKSLLS